MFVIGIFQWTVHVFSYGYSYKEYMFLSIGIFLWKVHAFHRAIPMRSTCFLHRNIPMKRTCCFHRNTPMESKCVSYEYSYEKYMFLLWSEGKTVEHHSCLQRAREAKCVSFVSVFWKRSHRFHIDILWNHAGSTAIVRYASQLLKHPTSHLLRLLRLSKTVDPGGGG